MAGKSGSRYAVLWSFALVLCLQYWSAVSAQEGPGQDHPPTNWALLIAGSRGYWNYRHQADVCHAYQILHKFGFPDDRVIVMMFDDIAYAPQNPTKGIIINRPGGPNVYSKVPKDYTGYTVTPENFLAVLSGNASGVTGSHKPRVIESGPEDRVFVYFSDHGGFGLIAMPNGDFLFAKDLIDTLLDMAHRKQFKELVFYMEACESGSMFEHLLPDNVKIFATTAANSQESSYACYYDPTRGTFLGDLYSVEWMEDTEGNNVDVETIQEQFEDVRNATAASHVMEWGDLNIAKEPLAKFLEFRDRRMDEKHRHDPTDGANAAAAADAAKASKEKKKDAIDARDIVMHTLMHRYLHATDPVDKAKIKAEIEQEMAHRDKVDGLFRELALRSAGPINGMNALEERRRSITDWNCYKSAVYAYRDSCGGFSDYALKYTYLLANLCEVGTPVEAIEQHLVSMCAPVPEPVLIN